MHKVLVGGQNATYRSGADKPKVEQLIQIAHCYKHVLFYAFAPLT